jgi:hypothetical protein
MQKDSALPHSAALKKDCFGATPKPTRETHALPGALSHAKWQKG